MELERFTKNKKRKTFVIGAIIGICATIGGIFLYKSYAYYESEKEYNVIEGIVPDFSYDVKFAIEVDNVKQDNIPTTPKGTGKDKYYKVTATCDEGIKAEWDYNAWNLRVENINKGTKCKLAFNSELTEEDYQEYIEAGVAYRRNTYRGKDITNKLKDGSLFSEISSGKFDDIFVGDYITSSSGQKDVSSKTVVWLIADLDNYFYTGNPVLNKHHATIIPAIPLMNATMNSTNTTIGGYAGSAMVGYEVGSDEIATTTKNGGTLDTVLTTYIEPDFGNNNPSKDNMDHIIPYNNLLTNKVDKTRINREGITNGASSNWAWYSSRKLDLMSEINVYGSTVQSSSLYDTGIDNRQYAIFKLKHKFMDSYGTYVFQNWLKDVVSSSQFAGVGGDGSSRNFSATFSTGVRPRFLIG